MVEGPSLLSLRKASIGFGGEPLFSNLDVSITKGDRICLVGRNGSGKSTLLKALVGLVEIDTGVRFFQPGLRIGYLPQEFLSSADLTVSEFVSSDGVPGHHVAAKLDEFKLVGDRLMGTLSGGEKRRAALARAFVASPDILLLDEPTNHLDLPTIERLEAILKKFPGGWLAISHDRAFLNNITQSTLWLRTGRLLKNARGFNEFEPWSQNVLISDITAQRRSDKHLQAELRYLNHGVTARRRRNQRRLRILDGLRAARARRPRTEIGPKMTRIDAGSSGKLVLDAQALVKTYDDHIIVNKFSTRILKGDRVGIIGGNGVGKSTLSGLLTGTIRPDSGHLRLAMGLCIAHFDQGHQSLDPNLSPIDILCEGGGDTIVVNGRQRSVAAYLSDFLFQKNQVRSPIRSLSGGEQSRLLLARILAQPSNLLVLDEPTNNLDTDTLDVLQQRLQEYEGTLLVVSHDRNFLDNLVTSIIAMEGNGDITEYAGGYSDYLQQRPMPIVQDEVIQIPKRSNSNSVSTSQKPKQRLTWSEKKELEQLSAQIMDLEKEIALLETTLADPNLFAADPDKFVHGAKRLTAANLDKTIAEERWLELEIKKEKVLATWGI